MSYDDEIAIAFAAGIFALPGMLAVFLLWEGWLAEAVYRWRTRMLRRVSPAPRRPRES